VRPDWQGVADTGRVRPDWQGVANTVRPAVSLSLGFGSLFRNGMLLVGCLLTFEFIFMAS
jgi:hypothetical protein